MNHILIKCEHPTRQSIWTVAWNVWPHRDNTWPEITLRVILGCGILNIKTVQNTGHPGNRNTENTPTIDTGATCLAKILISESACNLVTTVRCERVIQGKDHTLSEAEATWHKVVNRRLTEDIITVLQIQRRENIKQIENTWGKALRKKHGELPEDWIKQKFTL